MTIIALDTVRKYRNANEYRPINRARLEAATAALYGIEGDMEVVHDGNASIKLMKMIIAAGVSPSTVVVLQRGSTPASKPRSLSAWVNPPKRPQRPLERPPTESLAA